MDTIDWNDAYTVTSLDDLAKIYANPLPHIATKEADHITEVGRAFIAASPFLVLATSDGTSIDCSPKGDAPGFVQLLDDRTLLIPDRPGNNRIDGMKNLLVNPNRSKGTGYFSFSSHPRHPSPTRRHHPPPRSAYLANANVDRTRLAMDIEI